MNDWWAKKLAERQGPPQPGIPVAPQRTSTPQVPQHRGLPPQTAVPAQYAPQGQVVQGVEEPGSFTEALHQERNYVPDQAVGTRTETSSCPGCGGNNYFSRAQGIVRGPAPQPQCFDCGYPLVQAGSGLGSLGGASGSGSATPARQVSSGGFNPGVIVGKV